jgi:hypothetical protein
MRKGIHEVHSGIHEGTLGLLRVPAVPPKLNCLTYFI